MTNLIASFLKGFYARGEEEDPRVSARTFGGKALKISGAKGEKVDDHASHVK